MKVAFLHEHPTWSDRLIAALIDDGIDLLPINIAELAFDTSDLQPPYDLLINRVNIMPHASRHPSVAFHTLHFLGWLQSTPVRVLNGYRAHAIGASKAMQNGLFARLGLRHPRAIAIHRPEDALPAAEAIGFPLIVKPNLGGSGSGIARYDDMETLQHDVLLKAIDLGIDRSGIVQQYIESDGFVYRVEILGDELFYSIRQPVVSGEFNYCAADGCAAVVPDGDDFDFCAAEGGRGIELHQPSETVVRQVISLLRAADADIGGVEYFLERDSGEACFYDFNPYSNFVAGGEDLLGFSPERRFVDFIRQQMETLDHV